MGTDIHGYVEARTHGHWHGIQQLKTVDLRYYGFFAKLFGVRSEGWDVHPVAARRGLPTDISAETRALIDKEEAACQAEEYTLADEPECHHSDTWIGAQEFFAAVKDTPYHFHDTEWTTDIAPLVSGLAYIYGPENVRLVVWFDN